MTLARGHEEALASLFSPGVAVACTAAATHAPRLAEPTELADASPGRQLEFAAGRFCAARVLEQLGAREHTVARGPEGEPLWPQGYVGSISHAEGLCAAVAASATDVGAIGVDIERDAPVTAAFAHRVCSEAEAFAITELGAPVEALALVVFAAKEAIQKLQFRLTQDVIGLRRVQVILSADAFTARFQVALPPFQPGDTIRGRWVKRVGLIWTGAFLPATDPIFARLGADDKKNVATAAEMDNCRAPLTIALRRL